MRCDYSISGAKIYTLAEEGQCYTTLGVQGGKIAYLGNSLPEQPGRVVNVEERTIVPGFIDTHIHLSMAALLSMSLDLRFARSFADIRDSILAYVELKEYPGGMVLGFGVLPDLLSEGRWPNRFDLDRIIDDLPIILIGGEGHSLVANTLALRHFNLPPDMRGIDRDPVSGQDTGILHAHAFFKATERLASGMSLERLVRGMVNVNNLIASRGVTYLHASEGSGVQGDIDILGVKAIAPALDVGVRVYGQSRDVRRIQLMGLSQIGGCSATAVDGSTITHTAAFHSPYRDRQDEYGVTYFTQEELEGFVFDAHKADMQVNLHAIGDRAIDMTLKAYERALTLLPRRDHRHRIEHCIFPTDEQLDRIAELRLVVSTQPTFASLDPRLRDAQVRALGEERMMRRMPLRSMLDRGIIVCGSSDMPVMDTNPLAGVQAAVTHPNPEQRTSLYQALRMHTYHGAVAGFMEDRKGTLEVGKDADFVVLDQDPFVVPAEKVGDIRVVATYIGGEAWQPRPASWADLLWRSAGGRNLVKTVSTWLSDRVRS